MVIVPLHKLHVDANFKESELEQIHIGQKVRLTSDLYGNRVVYQGVVDGFSGGTGAAFATIPAQNATGNWIKVVQRVPVRIQLQPAELTANPLSVGVSMRVRVDTRSD
jgi:membrane fusion protein (multidrug efflux system)